MSAPLACLLVDNAEDFLQLGRRLLHRRLLDLGVPTHVTVAKSSEEAHELFESHGPGHFGLVFTDMLFAPLDSPHAPPENHVPMGIEIVTAAARAKAGFIVGYTKGGGDQYAKLHADARRAGAHFFCTRQQLTAPQPDAVFPELVSAMQRAGAVRPPGGQAEATPAASATTGQPEHAEDRRLVAVVHGRNNQAVEEVFTWLRAVGLRPVEFRQAISWTQHGSPTIQAALDQLFARTQAVLVLLTPDECVRLHPRLAVDEPDERGAQPRPNVYFEAGMAWVLNRRRTVFVWLGRVRPASDLAGLHAQVLDDSAERRDELFERLQVAGCDVQRSNAMYRGALEPTVAGMGYEPDAPSA